MTLLLVEEALQKDVLRSMIVNSVHDSVVIDVYPNEEERVKSCIQRVEKQLQTVLNLKFAMQFDVPLSMECKIGDNWMEVVEYR